MIKVLFMAKETLSSVLALKFLCERHNKVEIVAAVIRDNDLILQKMCRENSISILTENEIKELYFKGKLEVDYLFSFYWKRVKKDILTIPNKGSINFHPGPLPEARGSGYHIAILENWGYWGVTAHYMDEEFDTGAIIESRHFTIDHEIVNKDLVRITHERLFLLFEDIVDRIIHGEELGKKEQEEGRYFSIQELEDSKLISQCDNIEDITRKIRAFWNPPHSGAQIEIGGEKYTVINESILNWIAELYEEKYSIYKCCENAAEDLNENSTGGGYNRSPQLTYRIFSLSKKQCNKNTFCRKWGAAYV